MIGALRMPSLYHYLSDVIRRYDPERAGRLRDELRRQLHGTVVFEAGNNQRRRSPCTSREVIR